MREPSGGPLHPNHGLMKCQTLSRLQPLSERIFVTHHSPLTTSERVQGRTSNLCKSVKSAYHTSISIPWPKAGFVHRFHRFAQIQELACGDRDSMEGRLFDAVVWSR